MSRFQGALVTGNKSCVEMRLRAEGNRTRGQDYGGMGHFISDLHMILLWGLPYLPRFCRCS